MDISNNTLVCKKCRDDLDLIYKDVCMRMFGDKFVSNTYMLENGRPATVSDDLILEYNDFVKSLETLMSEIVMSIVRLMFEHGISVNDLDNHRVKLYGSEKQRVMPWEWKKVSDAPVHDHCLYILDSATHAVMDGVKMVMMAYEYAYINEKNCEEPIFVEGSFIGVEVMVIRLFIRSMFKKFNDKISAKLLCGTSLFARSLQSKVESNHKVFIIERDQNITQERIKAIRDGDFIIAYSNIRENNISGMIDYSKEICHISNMVFYITKFSKLMLKQPVSSIAIDREGEVCLYEQMPICKCKVIDSDPVSFVLRMHHDLFFMFDENVVEDTSSTMNRVYEDRHAEDYNEAEDEDGVNYCEACARIAGMARKPYDYALNMIVKKSYLRDGDIWKLMPTAGARVIFDGNRSLFKYIKKYMRGEIPYDGVITGRSYMSYFIILYFDRIMLHILQVPYRYNDRHNDADISTGYDGVNARLLYNPLREGRDTMIKKYPPNGPIGDE